MSFCANGRNYHRRIAAAPSVQNSETGANKMGKILKFAVAAGVSLAFVAPASAATTICLGGGCAGPNPNSNVLLINGASGTTINGLLNNAPGVVTFSSIESLVTKTNGQARIEAADGVLNNPFTIAYVDGLISRLELNINALTPGNVTFTFSGGNSDGLVLGAFALGENGSNFYNAFNGTFRNVTVSFGAGATVKDIRQVRITAAAAVPEPSTWALMLLGFGAVGFAMRRRNIAKPKVSFG
jgi:PEP-CTERM motif